MRYELKSYNDLCFNLEVVRFGLGITGLVPKISIRQFSLNQYWNGSAWVGTITLFNMVPVDAVNMPGVYTFDFTSPPNPIDSSVDTRYVVKITEPTQPITEYIQVTLNRFDDIIKNKRTIVQNIANFFDATTGFNAPLSTVGTVTNVTNTVDANIVDWNGTSPTLTKDATSNLPETSSSHITPGVRADIANGILNANIWNPIVDTTTLVESPADRDSIARAIVSSHIAAVHKTSYDLTTTEDVHTCSYTDSSKFYSPTLPILSDLEKLIKQDAIILKGWTGSGIPDTANYSQVKMRIIGVGSDSNGRYLELEAYDASTLAFIYGADSLIITNVITADPEEIATAVWEEPVSGHATAGTFGLLNRVVAGLVHFNHRIKDTEYDQTGRLTGCRVSVYASPSDTEADINPLTTIIISSTYNSGNNMSSYISTEE
jgi:hypothetical protein